MPWDYLTHKARLHSDESYKLQFYAKTRRWLKNKLKSDPDYAFLYRVKRRVQARKRRRRAKLEQKRLQTAIKQNTGHPA